MARAPTPKSARPKQPHLSRILSSHAKGAIEDYEFLRSLMEWANAVPGRSATPDAEWPEAARMLKWLYVMYAELSSGGSLYFVDRTVGDHCVDLERWLRRIEAKKGAAYLKALARLYPGGVVPVDLEQRERALSEDDRFEHDGALSVLDRKYQDAVLDEMPRKLRDYVAAHVAEIKAESKHAARQTPHQDPSEIVVRDSNVLRRFARLRELALKLEQEGKLPDHGPFPAIGDVIEVFAERRFAYVQVTHEHFYHETQGPIVRVFDSLSARPLTAAAVKKLVARPEVYFSIFDIRSHLYVLKHDPAMYPGLKIRTVANLPIPSHAAKFPRFLFHLGKTRNDRNAWGTWTGGAEEDERFTSPLSEELKALPSLQSDALPEFLVINLARGWRPLNEFRSHGGEV